MNDWDEPDRWVETYERDQDDYAEWLEARELERADTLAERGGEHKPMKANLGSATGAVRLTPLVKGEVK